VRAQFAAIANEVGSHPNNDPAITTGAAVFRAVIVDSLCAAGANQAQATAALQPEHAIDRPQKLSASAR